MKICFVCNEYPPGKHGGIGPVTQTLAEGLVRMGHHAEVVGLYAQPVDSVDVQSGVTVHRLHAVGSGRLGALRSRWKLTQYIAGLHGRTGFDLIEAPEWRGDSALLKISVPVVLRLHTSHAVDRMVTNSSRPDRLTRFFENLALKKAVRICTVSRDIAVKTAKAFPDFCLRLERESVPVILNAVDLEVFRPGIVPREDDLLVFVGSIKPKKGVDKLLQAFDLVRSQQPCRLLLAGSDTIYNKHSFLEYCLNGVSVVAKTNVESLGRCSRDEVAQLFSRASVVVLPSLQEACPLVVMEAMACGAPVVFGACGPHAEIIDDGVDGLLCDPRSPEDIAQKIMVLLDSPELSAALGAAARRKAEEYFGVGRFLAQSLEFYETAIHTYHRRPGKAVA